MQLKQIVPKKICIFYKPTNFIPLFWLKVAQIYATAVVHSVAFDFFSKSYFLFLKANGRMQLAF